MAKETRMTEFRNLSKDEMILEGYAVTFENPTALFERRGVKFLETVDKNAFSKTRMKDCCLKYNHSDHVPILARCRGGSMELKTDDTGLFFRAVLFDTQSARDVYKLVENGALDKCSFSFTLAENGSEYDRITHTRKLMHIADLWDVSVADIPAYDTTSVYARNFFSAEAEKEELESSLRRIRTLRTKIHITNIIYADRRTK